MVKSRETPITTASGNSKTDMDLSVVVEDNWVIVNKQRVTIWIPPSPTAKQPTTCLDTGPTQITRKDHSIIPEIPAPEHLITRKVHQSKLSFSPVSRSLYRCLLLDKKMRSANLEVKIQRAGGLSRWLASLGLLQFVRMFQKKRVCKFQLANLTMKRLKDMGADPVGPRRKLMHAIDCVSQSCRLKSIQTFY